MGTDVVEKPYNWLAVLRDLNVVSKKQHSEWLQGLDILAEAQTQAEKIIADARVEAATIKPAEETAMIPQVVRPPAEETADKTAEVNALWTRIGKKFEEELVHNRSIVLSYARDLAASVLDETLSRSNVFEAHLEKLAAQRTSVCLTVTVHPEKVRLVEEAKKKIPALKDAKVEKDRNLRPSDVKLGYEDGDKAEIAREKIEIRLKNILASGIA
jgi:hypothetical protein